MHKRIKPSVTCSVGVTKAEPVTTILVEVKFDGYARFIPGVNYTKLALEKKIVGGNNIKHWRSGFRHIYRAHAAINRTDKSQFHTL